MALWRTSSVQRYTSQLPGFLSELPDFLSHTGVSPRRWEGHMQKCQLTCCVQLCMKCMMLMSTVTKMMETVMWMVDLAEKMMT